MDGVGVTLGSSEEPRKQVESGDNKSFSYVQLVCSFCKYKKIKCDGQSPCSSCKRSNKTCVYFADNDRRRRKYHTDYINYLEGKTDVLTKFINEFVKDSPELSNAFHEKLSQVIQKSSKKQEQDKEQEAFTNDNLNDHLLDMMQEATNLKLDEDDNVRSANSHLFLNHSNEYDDFNYHNSRSPYSELTSSTFDRGLDEDLDPLTMNGLNIVFKDEAFREHLTDCFEQKFAIFYHSYTLILPQVRTWKFSSPLASRQLLMCSIFAVGAVYSDHPFALRSRKLFIAELEYIAINACRSPLDTELVMGLSLLSMYELGMGNDSISYLFNSMACSLTQHMGLHIAYDQLDSKSLNYAPKNSPVRSSILWGICLQDRIITSICNVQSCIHFKRIIAPVYLTVLGPEDKDYLAELSFASETRLWYIFDRFMDQICSENGDIGDTNQRTKLLETLLDSLAEFRNSLPSPLMLSNKNNNKFVMMLHYTYYTLICHYHKLFVKVRNSSTQQLVQNAVALANILQEYSRVNSVESLPYHATYLIYSNSLIYLTMISMNKNTAFQNPKEEENYLQFKAHFKTSISLLMASLKIWKRPRKALEILQTMCLQSGIGLNEFFNNTQSGSDAYSAISSSQNPDLSQEDTKAAFMSSPVDASFSLGGFTAQSFEFDSNNLFQGLQQSSLPNQSFNIQSQNMFLNQGFPQGPGQPITSPMFQALQNYPATNWQNVAAPSTTQAQQQQSSLKFPPNITPPSSTNQQMFSQGNGFEKAGIPVAGDGFIDLMNQFYPSFNPLNYQDMGFNRTSNMRPTPRKTNQDFESINNDPKFDQNGSHNDNSNK